MSKEVPPIPASLDEAGAVGGRLAVPGLLVRVWGIVTGSG